MQVIHVPMAADALMDRTIINVNADKDSLVSTVNMRLMSVYQTHVQLVQHV